MKTVQCYDITKCASLDNTKTVQALLTTTLGPVKYSDLQGQLFLLFKPMFNPCDALLLLN